MATETEDLGPSPEVMWPLSRIADRDQVSKPTVSIHVKRLVERHGLEVTRDNLGRVALVNVVQYDNLRGQFGDASKAQAPRRDDDGGEGADEAEAPRPAPAAASKTSLEEAQRRRAWFEVEKRRLEMAELRGQLIRADRYLDAVGRCGDELVRLIEQLPQEADAFAVELDFDDVHRVRIALKGLARTLRERLSKAFEALSAGAPAFDDPIDDDDADEEGAA